MNPSCLFSILLIVASVSLISCSQSTDQNVPANHTASLGQSASVEAELKQTRDRLTSAETENRELQASNKMLTEKLKEIQEAAEVEAKKAVSGTPSGGPSGAVPEQTRIALMGAKAIAEFRAREAERHVESLKAELSKKDDEMRAALEKVESISHENDDLKNKLDTLSADTAQKEMELDQTVKKLESTVSERATTIAKQDADLKEKEDLIGTLKKAWSDASQLKTSLEAGLNQAKTNLAECEKQNNGLKASLDQQQKETAKYSGDFESLKKDHSSCIAQTQALKKQLETCAKQIEALKAFAEKQKASDLSPKEKGSTTSVVEQLLGGPTQDKSTKEK